MKKILLVLIMALVVSLLGCVSKNNSIELKEKGKEEYYVGERFSCEGYTLLVTIDGKTKKVNPSLPPVFCIIIHLYFFIFYLFLLVFADFSAFFYIFYIKIF